jgi:hypothetical protein
VPKADLHEGLIGSGDTKERSIIDETPNLVARLQAIAEPNTVVIADGWAFAAPLSYPTRHLAAVAKHDASFSKSYLSNRQMARTRVFIRRRKRDKP